MPDPKIYKKQRQEKLEKLYNTLSKTSSTDRKANILWQWIKTDVITHKEFQEILLRASIEVYERTFLND